MEPQAKPESFTTVDYINKIKETIALTRDILQHPNAQNEKVQSLLGIQSRNCLQLLNTLNQNEDSKNFTRPNFSDEQSMMLVNDINDAVVDKIIHYTERAKNIMEGRQELIEVQLKMTPTNSPSISIKDYKRDHAGAFALGGVKRRHSEMSGERNQFHFVSSSNIKRPQVVYNIKVDNNFSTPFIPRLTYKPNAVVPFVDSIKPIGIEHKAESIQSGINLPDHYYPQPYEPEIEQFEVPLQFLVNTSQQFQKPDLNSLKPIQYISKKDELKALVETLKQYKEIAVDVEHHSFRSYQGLTCLLQISTDDFDYIIDVFPLWNEMQVLNEVFTCPTILKVFHSATYDIIWLQRDLGIYVVNMFDTWVAATTLQFAHCSLSYLVEHFCNFKLDKRFQLADWRMRPLTDEMLQYARYDTFFLLYIYRKMKQELLGKSDESANLLRSVMQRSRELCLKRYEKKLLESTDYVHLVWKHNLKFNSRQMSALRSLYIWRDVIARNQDESPGYVLPNNLLLKICEILPREQQGILACCNPIPPLVRQYINEIHKLIIDARSRLVEEKIDQKQENVTHNRDLSIDLTNDHLIDQPERHKESDLENLHHEITPLFEWNAERAYFVPILNSGSDDSMTGGEANSALSAQFHSSLSDLFVSNVARFVRDDHQRRQRANRVDQLFVGYISPYQRYSNTLELKGEEPKQEAT